MIIQEESAASNGEVNSSNSNSQKSKTTRTSSSSNNGNSGNGNPNQHERLVWVSSLVFVGLLVVVAVCLGIGAFYLLKSSEADLANAQFESIANTALQVALSTTMRKRNATTLLASLFAETHPNASKSWPLAPIDGINNIVKHVIDISNSSRGYLFLPLVQPGEEAAEFERQAIDYFHSNKMRPTHPNPDLLGKSSFGRGIWSMNPQLNTTDKRYHDTTGTTLWGSPYTYLAPVFQTPTTWDATPFYLMNFHFSKERGTATDRVYKCSAEQQQQLDSDSNNRNSTSTTSSRMCTSMSELMWPLPLPESEGPGAVIVSPVYPAFHPTTLTGFTVTHIHWKNSLERAFLNQVSGIHCVMKSRNDSFTYQITDGVSTFLGPGDLHDRKYNSYGQSMPLTGDGLFTEDSPTVTLTVYPTDQFINLYSTRNPAVAMVGAVVIMVFTSLAFLLYNHLVRMGFQQTKIITDAKRQFMRFVSHEVRTPLNTVVMGLQLLQEDLSNLVHGNTATMKDGLPPLTDELLQDMNLNEPCGVKNPELSLPVVKLTGKILGSAQNAVSVLNDLLNYDKIEKGELPLEKTILSIWSLIDKAAKEFRLPYQAKNVKYEVLYDSWPKGGDIERPRGEGEDITTVLPQDVIDRRVVGDPIRLTQVVRNLISNALKFTEAGGSVKVQVSWDRLSPEDEAKAEMDQFELSNLKDEVEFKRSGRVRLTVTDTGVGLSSEQVERLYKPGVQFNVNELQAGKGSGLGLYIAKGICEQHGGTLTAASKGLGKGSSFTVVLPLHYIPEHALPKSLQRFKPPTNNSSSEEVRQECGVSSATNEAKNSSLRILVVDDAAMNRKLLCRLLTNRGHYCDEAEDGKVAVDRVKKLMTDGQPPYDTILLDYEMPVMNGPTAATQLRDLGCDSFICGITGNILPEDVNHFKECGANWVFPKPLMLADLESVWIEYGKVH